MVECKGPRPHVASLKRAKQGKLPLEDRPMSSFPPGMQSPDRAIAWYLAI